MIPIRLRLVLAGVVSMLTMNEGWATGTVTLGKHTAACRSYQDIIILNANGENSTFHKIFPSKDMMLKYIFNECREYTAGETVDVEKEQSFEGVNFECIKIKGEHSCFWALNGDAHSP